MKEAELIRQCQKGNAQAQRELFDRFADRFFRLSFRYLRSHEDAEDTVMTAFVKIFHNINSFRQLEGGSAEAWMRRIVVNESLMLLRRQNNFNLTERLDSDNPVHDTEVLQDVDGDYLYELIVDLPVGYRTVFNMHVVEGYDHREIGELLGITESTSRSQLFKAKQLLKRKIKKEGINYGT